MDAVSQSGGRARPAGEQDGNQNHNRLRRQGPAQPVVLFAGGAAGKTYCETGTKDLKFPPKSTAECLQNGGVLDIIVT